MGVNPYPARWIVDEVVGRPWGWATRNLRELRVECVWTAIRDYYRDPNPMTRDVMLTHAFDCKFEDLPPDDSTAVSAYEVSLVLRIYRAGCCFVSSAVKLFAYHVVMEWVRIDRRWQGGAESQERRNLFFPTLQLFYDVFEAYVSDCGKKNFYDYLECSVRERLKAVKGAADLDKLEHAFVSLLMDVSCSLGAKRDAMFRIRREQLVNLIKLEAEILKRGEKSIMARPLKGTLMIQLSYLILKSRAEVLPESVYKHISNADIMRALENGELWVRDVRDLNDKWEGVSARELVDELAAGGARWLQGLDWEFHKSFYVACYSHEWNPDSLSSYGECVLAYNGDRLADFLGPIYLRVETLPAPNGGEIKEGYPMLSQVVVLDVVYDRDQARNELAFLVKCVDVLGNSDDEKRAFLGEILQYWKLSFKDPVEREEPHREWYRERERRYVIFYYEDYNYINQRIESRWLKMDSTVVLAPDAVLGPISFGNKTTICENLAMRYRHTSLDNYCLCRDCLARTYVRQLQPYTTCKICGSKNLTFYQVVAS